MVGFPRLPRPTIVLPRCPRARSDPLQATKPLTFDWQITLRVLTEAIAAGGAEAKRAFDAMMKMKKIDVATIVAARRG